MPLMTLLLLAGFGALYFGADWMVRGAARLGTSLGLSSIVIGLTVVSLGTSAPELFVAIMATMRGSADLAVGNVLGSNLANIGLILGLTAIICPLHVAGRVVKQEMPIMVALTLLVAPLVMDGDVNRVDGLVLVSTLAAYLAFVFYGAKKTPPPLLTGVSQLTEGLESRKRMAILGDVGLLAAGTAGLVLGGRAIVEAGTFLSREFGVSEMVIGLTVVAIGTSLPELATSIIAATRKQTDIAVGNVIGSNIFNIAAVLGVTGIITPIDVDPGVLWVELPATLVLSALVFFVTISPRRKGEFLILRWEGAVLLVAYLGLGAWILW